MFEKFSHLHKPKYEIGDCRVLAEKYPNMESLGGRFVAYSPNSGYSVFDTMGGFCSWFETVPECQRTLHEVIFGQRLQKIKFDIDAYASDLDILHFPDMNYGDMIGDWISQIDPAGAGSKYAHVLGIVIKAIENTFFMVYGVELSKENFIICESLDKTGRKFSNHVIIQGYCVTSNLQSREFTNQVCEHLPKIYHKFIDRCVNKSLQNFRITGCHKSEDISRVKTIVSGHSFAISLVCNTEECQLLDDIAGGGVDTPADVRLTAEEVGGVLELCRNAGLLEANKFRLQRGNMLIFDRMKPSHCDLCKRFHDNDNTVLVHLNMDGDTTYVVQTCRKYTQENTVGGSINLGQIYGKTNPNKPNNRIESLITKIKDQYMRPKTGFDDLPAQQLQVYNSPSLQKFELSRTLVIHAAMKMGKTTELHNYIDTHFKDQLRPTRIYFISFRQTFSSNIKEKFPEFTLYSDVKGSLSQDKLIIQVESLWRLGVQEGVEPPDLLILDESESIFEQFNSGLIRDFHSCFGKFQYLLRFSKHVICMDANISDRTFNVLNHMRPNFTNGLLYHHNLHKNAMRDKYWITDNKVKWWGMLYASIEAGERVVVPTSSLSEGKVLMCNLEKRYPTKMVKLYSSETVNSEKREHFSSVHKYWTEYDVLIYTPTISAGVSFEYKHYHKIFAYFTDHSCNVETCMQMIGRIRDVAHNQFHICIVASGDNLPCDREEIKEQLYERRKNLLSELNETGILVEYGKHGEVKYHVTDYFYIWLENTRIKNLSKNLFTQRFIQMVIGIGAELQPLTDETFELHTGYPPYVDGEYHAALQELNCEHSTAKEDIRDEMNANVANAAEFTAEEVDAVKEKMIMQEDITPAQIYSFEKYKLRSDYSFPGEITPKFVDTYRDPKVKRIYRNLVRINRGTNCNDALAGIKYEEMLTYSHIMASEGIDYQDLRRNYVFDQHRYALYLLKYCGWDGLNDVKYMHKVQLLDRFRNGEEEFVKMVGKACREFQVRDSPIIYRQNRISDAAYFAGVLKIINKILSLMYGLTVVSRKADPDVYYLDQCSLFTVGARGDMSKPRLDP